MIQQNQPLNWQEMEKIALNVPETGKKKTAKKLIKGKSFPPPKKGQNIN